MGHENEHDITRKMLNKIRESHSSNKGLLNEDEFETANSGFGNEDGNSSPKPNSEANDTVQPSQEELAQEQQRFREVVGPRVEFTTFNIYPKAGNVIFGGKFQDMDGMQWQFSLEETDGLFITTNQMQVSDDVVSRIQKLKGYYDNWAGEWSNKLATEYKGGNN